MNPSLKNFGVKIRFHYTLLDFGKISFRSGCFHPSSWSVFPIFFKRKCHFSQVILAFCFCWPYTGRGNCIHRFSTELTPGFAPTYPRIIHNRLWFCPLFLLTEHNILWFNDSVWKLNVRITRSRYRAGGGACSEGRGGA